MDPNANLEEQREIIARSRERAGDYDAVEDSRDLARLGDLIEALDQWITGGGFLPDAWNGFNKGAGQ